MLERDIFNLLVNSTEIALAGNNVSVRGKDYRLSERIVIFLKNGTQTSLYIADTEDGEVIKSMNTNIDRESLDFMFSAPFTGVSFVRNFFNLGSKVNDGEITSISIYGTEKILQIEVGKISNLLFSVEI